MSETLPMFGAATVAPTVPRPSWWRAGVRLLAFGLLTVVMVPPYLLALAAAGRLVRPLARAWYRGVCGLAGLDLRMRGRPVVHGAALMVANHVSYLDVPVLGAILDARFVAKAEVADWPVFGWLAKLGRTVFIRRDRRAVAGARDSLAEALGSGHRLVLFPEGTSTDGTSVRPFRSSLFDAAARSDVIVQPISIVYGPYGDGRPLRGPLRDAFAWYGDMTLGDHLLRLFGYRGCRVTVTFHRPLCSGLKDRKALALASYRAVATGVAIGDDGGGLPGTTL